MKEIRVHGRGGQGGMAGAKMLATAFVLEGRWAQSFPEIGFERRGAPIMAFVRMDDKPVREKTKIYTPDCLLVIDPVLVNSTNTFDGLKPDGILVMNGLPSDAQEGHGLAVVGSVDATQIGLEEVGMAITNTCMLGAFARTTEWVKLDSLLKSLSEFYSGELLKKNSRCVERGYYETTVTKMR